MSRRSRHRLVIFVDHDQQLWLWPDRRPLSAGLRLNEHHHTPGVRNEALLRRLARVSFTSDDEAALNLMGVLARLRTSPDAAQVTKRFFKEYTKHHDLLLTELKGIDDQSHRIWYASVLLNRLMFMYFMQKKGFLDDDKDYLLNRLHAVRSDPAIDSSHGFFRRFLLPLIHYGLGSHHRRFSDARIKAIVGDVPYVDGTIFAPHQLEDRYNIDVPDRALEDVFRFFDRYRWHLDSRSSDDPNAISPDVLGHVFEQYVNQKEQGAYYTKEDVTGYMTGVTVIPAFFDRACADGGPWHLLAADPDRYIYDSVRHAVEIPLPDDIARGIGDHALRDNWADKAPPSHGLPGETWWEVIERRRTYERLQTLLASGAVVDTDAAITANLDLRVLADDYIRSLPSIEAVEHVYRSLTKLTILDPTVGSGTFLLGALDILEDLYRAIVDRAVELGPSQRRADFHDSMEAHPSTGYFILKTAVLSNLYGVDIVSEAGEIARLRMFLRLVAQLNDRSQLEPLPDLDFNIRTGNLLVGIATISEGEERLGRDLFGSARLDEITEAADEAASAYGAFIAAQHSHTDPDEMNELKVSLTLQLSQIRDKLDTILHTARTESTPLNAWVDSHQPFHWLVEFPGIQRRGGFDVVVGNPPYVPSNRVTAYRVAGLRTARCPDIYAMCVERSLALLAKSSYFAMILPHSISFSSRFPAVRGVVEDWSRAIWVSSYSRIPAGLFSAETRVRNSIVVAAPGAADPALRTTACRRWIEAYRPHLFQTLSFAAVPSALASQQWPFLGSDALGSVFSRLSISGRTIADALVDSQSLPEPPPGADGAAATGGPWALLYRQSAYNWLPVFTEPPPVYGRDGERTPQTKMGVLWFTERDTRDAALAVLAGKWGFAWWCVFGDDFDVTARLLEAFPLDPEDLAERAGAALAEPIKDLKAAMLENVVFKSNAGKRVGNYHLGRCRAITDRIDRVLAEIADIDGAEALEVQYHTTIKTELDPKWA